MTDGQRALVLREAVFEMGKTLREHPIDMDWYLEEPERLRFLAGGCQRDPEGKEIAAYFVAQAHKKLKEMGLIEDETLG